MEQSSIDIKLKKTDRVYRVNDMVEGITTINAKGGWAHKGVNLVSEGTVYLSSGRGTGLGLDSSSSRPISIFKYETEIAGAGRFADGSTEVPFKFKIASKDQLLESYHGVYVSIIYNIHIDCERGMMKKSLHRDLEFIVEVPSEKTTDAAPATFDITPESLENVAASVLATIPRFSITGRLHRSNFPINQPFTGEVIIQSAAVPIRSLELQLVRVETVIVDGKTSREATEIQNIQIGDGNICRDMVVPMYMVFPRLFSCPTVSAVNFRIEFEVNLIVVFGEGYMITENFPITLSRDS